MSEKTNIVSKQTLTRKYWRHVDRDLIALGGFIEPVGDRQRGKPARYKLIAPMMPDKDELSKLVVKRLYTYPMIELVSEASSDFDSLKEEMDDWRGNLEDNGMDHLPKYEEVSECVDALEQLEGQLEDINWGGAAEVISQVEVVCDQRGLDERSRASRAESVCQRVRACVDELQDLMDDENWPRQLNEAQREVTRQEGDSILETLQNFVDELECIDYPGAR